MNKDQTDLGKAVFKTSKFDINNSIKQQEVYKDIFLEVIDNYSNVLCVEYDTANSEDVIKYELDILLSMGG